MITADDVSEIDGVYVKLFSSGVTQNSAVCFILHLCTFSFCAASQRLKVTMMDSHCADECEKIFSTWNSNLWELCVNFLRVCLKKVIAEKKFWIQLTSFVPETGLLCSESKDWMSCFRQQWELPRKLDGLNHHWKILMSPFSRHGVCFFFLKECNNICIQERATLPSQKEQSTS